jgi:peptidoglycan/LPS O-acetylase OafA/YrhL
MTSIGDKLEESRGIGPGFDFLRLFLATLVVFSHAFVVTGSSPESNQAMWFVTYFVLAMFFSLSGFLITGSALRLKLSDFLTNRFLRIVPALGMDIVLSALVLGPLVTSYATGDYFSNASFFKYFFNIVGFPHYVLPGVFTSHPWPQVNISLWTVPWEISCYVIMSLLIYFTLLTRIFLIASIVAAITLTGCVIVGLDHGFPVYYAVNPVVHYFLGQTGSRLIICFLLGILFFQRKSAIPYSKKLFVACIIWCLALAVFVKAGSVMASCPIMNVFAAVPVAYIMVFVGVSKIPRIPVLHRGDYSYGIYLYGFPIQQMVFSMIPGAKSPVENFVASMPFIIGFAMLSWHGIEKPILRLRRKFFFVAKERLAETPQSCGSKVGVSVGTIAEQATS